MQTVLRIDDARLRTTLAIQRHGVAEMHNLCFFRMIRGYCVAKRRHKSIGQRADRTAPVRRNKCALFYYIGTKR